MIVVWIVFCAILLVSFITGIIITVIEEKKLASFVILDAKLLPNKIRLVQAKTTMVTGDKLERTIRMSKIQTNEDNVEILSLEKTLTMKPLEVSNLENTMYFEKPILVSDYDEEII